MITNTNPTSKEYEEIKSVAGDLSGPATVEGVIDNFERRRNNVLNGGVNCIPLPFDRFRSEIPGIEQGQYVIVTANAKVGKTNLTNYLYVFHVLDYAFNNPTQCSVHIIYFALEEAVQKILERYMAYLLYKLNGLRYAPTELRSTSTDTPLPQEVIDLLKSEPYQERLRFFSKCVQFETENTNPTGILRVCEAYAKTVGDYKSRTVKSHGLSGKEVQVFESYTPHDPNHYKIAIIDHIGLVDKEQGFRTKDAVDKMSEYFVKYLRNRYGFTCVAIQQQAADAEGLEAVKQKKMLPSAASLGDSKYTARDGDLVIGLFDPSKFGMANWLGYKIQEADGEGLKNYGRFLYVIANRNGDMGGVCPLFFDGAICNFEELPRPDNVNEIAKYYNLARILKANKKKNQLNTLVLTLFPK